MWHLEKLRDETVEWFADTYLQTIYDSIHKADCGISTEVVNKLTKDVIKNLLIKEPEELYDYAENIENELKSLDEDWEKLRKRLLLLFGYEKNISRNKGLSYELADRIGTKTCVYCNRFYTVTIHVCEEVDGQTQVDEDKQRIVRPDFDHWLGKAEHPLTSMSLYNLIPSCPICNRSIKHRKEFKRNQHVHPYMSAVEPTFKFKYSPDIGGRWDLKIDGGTVQEKETAKILETEAVYKCHANMEVKDILDFLYSNTPDYLNDLFSQVLKARAGTITVEEAYKIIFGFESVSSKYLERPLSKLKHDILEQASENLGVNLI